MKRFLAAALIFFCGDTSSYADDVYGCIINESPLPVKGTIVSQNSTIPFAVQGSYVWCSLIPEGDYSVITADFSFHGHFNASWQHTVGSAGEKKLHWVIKIREKDLK